MITPYKDNPDAARPYGDDLDMQPFDSADMLESQRLMMQGLTTVVSHQLVLTWIVPEQDTHLDSLHSSLTRQHTLSQELSSELDVQAGLLTALDTDVDNTTSRLTRARRGLDKVGKGLGANGQSFIPLQPFTAMTFLPIEPRINRDYRRADTSSSHSYYCLQNIIYTVIGILHIDGLATIPDVYGGRKMLLNHHPYPFPLGCLFSALGCCFKL